MNKLESTVQDMFKFIQNDTNLSEDLKNQLVQYQATTTTLIKKVKQKKKEKLASKTPQFALPKEDLQPKVNSKKSRKRKRKTEA